MSTATLTPRQVTDQARQLFCLTARTPWPESREARWAIGWALITLGDALDEYDGAVEAGEDRETVEAASEQARQCAPALARRFCEYARREQQAEEMAATAGQGAGR